ncbi:MAG TPA: hypothetical protein VIY07_03340 [Pseudolabrys sp.]
MDSIFAVFQEILTDSNTMFMGLLIFLAAGTLAFSLMEAMRVRGAVKKRTARIVNDDERRGHGRSLQYSSAKALSKLIEYTTKHYSESNQENMKVLRRRLIQAGIYDPRGVAFFFIGRTVLAIGLARCHIHYGAIDTADRRFIFLADGRGWWNCRLYRPELLYRSANFRTHAPASIGFSGLYGFARRVRGFRLVDGSFARARRQRAGPGLSVTQRQYPFDQS